MWDFYQLACFFHQLLNTCFFSFLASLYSNLATFYRRDNEYSFHSRQNKSLRLNHGNIFKIALCFSEYVLLPRTQFHLVFFVSFSQRSILLHLSLNTDISSLSHKPFSPSFFFFTDSLPCCLTILSSLLIVQKFFGRFLMFILTFALTYTIH